MDHSHFPAALPPASAAVPHFSEPFPCNVPHTAALVMPSVSAPAAAAAAVAAAAAAAGSVPSVSSLPFELEDMTTADLLNNINPELLDYVKCNTPHVYSGLLAQERTNTTPAVDPIIPVQAQQPPTINSQTPQLAAALASQMSSPSATHQLRLANSMRSVTPVPSVTSSLPVTPLGTNPTNSPSIPLLNPHAIQPTTAPIPMSMPPQIPDPALSVSNPALLAVLRQAQAMANVSHLHPQTAIPTRNFPPGNTLPAATSSPLQRPNNAAVAAVAGAAAAAAAAAAANCTIPQRVHPRFASASLQNKRFPERAHASYRAQSARSRTTVSPAQVARVLKSTQAPSKMRAVASTPMQLQPPQPPPPTILGQKRPNSAIKQAAGASATMINTSSATKQPSSLSSTTSHTVANPSAPASRSRLHPAAGALAGVNANGNSRVNAAASSASMGVPLKMEQTEEVMQQSAAVSGQASDTEEDADLEVKKAMRAERNRQSAAASRERKKQYIKELERRVDMLSQENAKMQVSQFRLVRERLDLESKILDEVKKLKRKVVVRDMEIHKLSRALQNAKLRVGEEEEGDGSEVPRPSTWDAAEWRKKKNRGSRRRV